MEKSHQRSCVTNSQNRLFRMPFNDFLSTRNHSFYKLILTLPTKLGIVVPKMPRNRCLGMKILRLTLKNTEVHFFKPLNTLIISLSSGQFNGIRSPFSSRAVILIKSHIMFFKISTHLPSLVLTFFSQRGITPTLNPIECIK